MDSATEFLFGDSVNSLTSSEGSEQDQFGRLFDLAQSRLGNRSRLGRLVALFRDTEFDDACKFVHQFVDKIIFNALEKAHPHDPEKSIESKSDRYVFLEEMLKSTRDPKQLRDELLNILLAGRDTTASLLSNTFHVLARRPDIWEKLKAEVDELQGVKPDYETLRNMKYLKNLLNECKITSPSLSHRFPQTRYCTNKRQLSVSTPSSQVMPASLIETQLFPVAADRTATHQSSSPRAV